MSSNRYAIERRVRQLNGTYFLRREVAEVLDCSVALLVKVQREDPANFGPSFALPWRHNVVFLYTVDDVRRLHTLFADRWPHLAIDPGPGIAHLPGKSQAWRPAPRLFDDGERRERQRRHTQAGAWNTRAERYDRRGQPELAADARKQCEHIRAQLRAERSERARPTRETADIDLVVH